ncbi:E3 ubiquitin-protein ligase ATL41-like [Vigna unguiculata]|uniref:Nucleolysin TIA-1/TIAR n=1 Tax=Vigna unguiculata TaxID=3917 RepID=A0A4D6KMK0_VIGUN|nr:E3 ubiquitin-protein ligase ATL41-like [Vigna unguiculata]QCD76827.1 nucleolysin TIA-1/TIAR [Vigna unguiculata]
MGSKDKHEDEESLSIGLKVMLAAAISLFGMISIIIIFHFSMKYFIIRQRRRRQNELLHQITTQIAPIDVSSVEARNPGLQTSIIASLPKLLFNQTEQFKQGEVIECSVCLATVTKDAIIRVLPNCKHIFHVDCVDKWFNCNSTCPICRTVVDPKVAPEEEDGDLGTRIQQVQPTAPPVVGDGEVHDGTEMEKVGCSGLRIGSFHRMVSNRERSGRNHSCDESTIDIERH